MIRLQKQQQQQASTSPRNKIPPMTIRVVVQSSMIDVRRDFFGV
jgi:hypothetical protein